MAIHAVLQIVDVLVGDRITKYKDVDQESIDISKKPFYNPADQEQIEEEEQEESEEESEEEIIEDEDIEENQSDNGYEKEDVVGEDVVGEDDEGEDYEGEDDEEDYEEEEEEVSRIFKQFQKDVEFQPKYNNPFTLNDEQINDINFMKKNPFPIKNSKQGPKFQVPNSLEEQGIVQSFSIYFLIDLLK